MDSTTPTEFDDEADSVTKQPGPQRTVTSATDSKGNKLAYSIDTHYYGPAKSSSNDGSSDTQVLTIKPSGISMETLRVTKAMALPIDNKTVIRISSLPGLETLQLSDSVTTTWYHLQAKQLDFAHFRQACLELPHLSRRLQTLTRDLLARIEKHKVKAYLDGLYVEPGIVMRVDERCQPDPQSAIFSCVPYFDLQEPITSKFCSLLECKTYFQMEQKLNELWRRALNTPSSDSLCMSDGAQLVTPKDWPSLVLCTDRIFIDLAALIGEKADRMQQRIIADLNNPRPGTGAAHRDDLRQARFGRFENLADNAASQAKDPADKASLSTLLDAKPVSEHTLINGALRGRVPPFFHWKTTEFENSQDEGQSVESNPADARHASQRLQLAEKSMASAILDSNEILNVVDESFSSTSSFEAISEDSQDDVSARFNALASDSRPKDFHTYHAVFVGGQCASFLEKSHMFCATVRAILRLLLRCTDESTMLRKLWGAMGNIHDLIAKLCADEADTETSRTRHSGWYVRNNK